MRLCAQISARVHLRTVHVTVSKISARVHLRTVLVTVRQPLIARDNIETIGLINCFVLTVV